MITTFAFIGMAVLAIITSKINDRERRDYDGRGVDDVKYLLLLHIRQDLKLISFLLFAVIILLAVIADVYLLGR